MIKIETDHVENEKSTMAGFSWKDFYNLELSYSYKLLNLDLKTNAKTVVEYTYNPLEYASELHCMFLERFFKAPTKLLFVGMNPGPYGMAQTGVPFGDVRSVFNWMKINGSIRVPKKQHPKKPVQGLKCTRNEVSGERFWRMFSQTLNLTPEEFFENAFVINVCPLLFLDKSGKNIALSTLPAKLRIEVELLCRELMLKTIEILQPHHIVAIGQYAHDQIKKMLKSESHPMFTTQLCNSDTVVVDIGETNSETMGAIINGCEMNETSSSSSSSSPPPQPSSSSTASSEITKSNGTSTNIIEPATAKTAPASLIITTTTLTTTSTTTTTLTTTLTPTTTALTTTSQQTQTQIFNRPILTCLMHPSPSNPLANKGWSDIAKKQLSEMGVLKYFNR